MKFCLPLLAIASSAFGASFVLDQASYPDVVDHHCIANMCGSLNAFGRLHRDAFGNDATKNSRRAKVGCAGFTDCQSFASGLSCDEIPYASTFDGGLGCYTAGWTGTDQLYDVATHRCVDATENSAHGSHLAYFYELFQIGQGGDFTVALQDEDPNTLPPANWCRLTNLIYYAVPLEGMEIEASTTLCYLQSKDGTQFRRVDLPGYTPGCPGRGFRRREDNDQSNSTSSLGPAAAAWKDRLDNMHVATLENGETIYSLMGPLEVGEDVWFGPTDSNANLTQSMKDSSKKNSKVKSVQTASQYRASKSK